MCRSQEEYELNWGQAKLVDQNVLSGLRFYDSQHTPPLSVLVLAPASSAGWSLDHTCIHGLNKASGVSVFPHAIAQGASWDRALVRRVSNATAIEVKAPASFPRCAHGSRMV